MWELERNVKEALKDYTIIELKTFMDAVTIAINKAPAGTDEKMRLIYTEGAVKDLICSKVGNFVNGL